LLRSLRARPELLVELHWRPFLLNPDIPRAGIPRGDHLSRKFGGSERAERLHGTIAVLGRAEGIEFHFDRIIHAPSSVNGHRLVALAVLHGLGLQMVEALFAAHFCEGLDIGDIDFLVRIATSVGLKPAMVRALLAGDEGSDLVHGENMSAHRIGVNGVPCFILGQRHAIAGAQEIEVFDRMIDVALADD
jgi:predicted DsbA family dithiol-disulfide isomerase